MKLKIAFCKNEKQLRRKSRFSAALFSLRLMFIWFELREQISAEVMHVVAFCYIDPMLHRSVRRSKW
jgi:hypothetical protein